MMTAASDSYPEIILAAPCAKGKGLTFIPKDGLFDIISSIISNNQDLNKEPFYVLDLGALQSLMQKWTRSLPAVRPFYAVKCNPEPVFLSAMAALGAGFDCASRAEIESVLSLGVSPDRIIYANPCKIASHIKYAANVGVNLTTFDSVAEIEKIQKYHPDSACLIRIKADHGGSRYPLGSKYGAIPEEFEELLLAAQSAKLAVCGVAFHVGSLASDVGAYRAAIGMAKTVFDVASRLRMPPMHVLDIGGGFTSSGTKFEDAANAVESALREYFRNEPGLIVIAEPGRFFAESALTLATNIFGKRVRGEVREYWINDGVFGSMNLVLTDNLVVEATPFACLSNAGDPTCRGVERTYSSTVFGPTLDAADTVVRGQELPELEVNDWLVFPNMGAHTSATGTNFNGFRTSDIRTHLVYSNPN